jgi:hypothetical protein
MNLGLTCGTRWKTDAAALVEAASSAGFIMLGTTSRASPPIRLISNVGPGRVARAWLPIVRRR